MKSNKRFTRPRPDRRFATPLKQIVWLGWILPQRPDLNLLDTPKREKLERQINGFCLARRGQGYSEEWLSSVELNDLASLAHNLLEMLLNRTGRWSLEIGDIWWSAQRRSKSGRIRSSYEGEFAALWPFLVNERLAIERLTSSSAVLAKDCPRFFGENKTPAVLLPEMRGVRPDAPVRAK